MSIGSRTTGRAKPAPRRTPRPAPSGGPRPDYPVRGPHPGRPDRGLLTERRRRRRTAAQRQWRLALSITAFLSVVAIFGAAVFHVMLVQSEFRLERLDDAAVVEQQRYEKFRLEVARLAAPERIVAAAQERLGMVPPGEIGYLTAPAQPLDDPISGALSGGWAEVKPYRAAHE